MSATTSYPKNKIKFLLLENIHESGQGLIAGEGFQLEAVKGALGEDELCERIRDVHVLGIRSKTNVTEKVLDAANRLMAVGCFCIGTNQVDLAAANKRGVPVFNAPFSNTRSVAEMTIAEIVMLARKLGDRSNEVHRGIWTKSAVRSNEVRGKTLGIVGYGRIGSQVGVLAESMGMRVVFFDVSARLPMGNSKPVDSLEVLMRQSDFVTLHVPGTPQTHEMIGAQQLSWMKDGAYVLNASRGTVIVIPALAAEIKSGRLGGAAVDVFPKEPKTNDEPFQSELCGLPNVILTPHIGGSTEEAQEAIGREVGGKLVSYVNTGTTVSSVNFPEVEPARMASTHRILNVHRNVPGVLSAINQIIADMGANVEHQILATDKDIGYLVMDINREVSDAVNERVKELGTSIKTRILY